MTAERTFAFSRRKLRPRLARKILPSNEREQGMPGACCTRGLVCKYCRESAHEHTGTAGAPRHSLRNGLTAYAALSLETNSSCLHHCRLDGSIDPVGSKSPPAASHQPRVPGPHGFAVRIERRHPAHRLPLMRFNSPCGILCADALASTASRLAFVTTAIRPSCRGGTARKKH